ncbi:hypothetical protein P3T76_010095 [Phytophthora citrophthora]|uniref:Uncharacterized protein n=1 Tax=Phytophthora citrophthora TaxID=4793 RepID=A0AAD9GEA2_9STRA|nr:hypothetical protein P3T76_010095 [Phytophthora citrophthora]
MSSVRTFSLYERDENSSILAAGQDNLDLVDDWNEQSKRPSSYWRNSCPDRRYFTANSRWSSRLSSLSSSMIEAGTALTSKAKELGGKSTQQAINQLRKSIVDILSLTKSSKNPTQHRFSEADIDLFGTGDQPECEKSGDEEENTDESKRLHPSKSWTQGC